MQKCSQHGGQHGVNIDEQVVPTTLPQNTHFVDSAFWILCSVKKSIATQYCKNTTENALKTLIVVNPIVVNFHVFWS